MLNKGFVWWVALALGAASAWGYSSYVSSIPNGTEFSCNNCHNIGANPFREDFAANGNQWNHALAVKDSDGDGATNGVELQDPGGAWRPGNPNPHRNNLEHV